MPKVSALVFFAACGFVPNRLHVFSRSFAGYLRRIMGNAAGGRKRIWLKDVASDRAAWKQERKE